MYVGLVVLVVKILIYVYNGLIVNYCFKFIECFFNVLVFFMGFFRIIYFIVIKELRIGRVVC